MVVFVTVTIPFLKFQSILLCSAVFVCFNASWNLGTHERGLRSEFCKTEDTTCLQLLKQEPRLVKDVDAAALNQIEKPLGGCWAWRGVASAFWHSAVCQIRRRAVFFSFSLFACFFFFRNVIFLWHVNWCTSYSVSGE